MGYVRLCQVERARAAPSVRRRPVGHEHDLRCLLSRPGPLQAQPLTAGHAPALLPRTRRQLAVPVPSWFTNPTPAVIAPEPGGGRVLDAVWYSGYYPSKGEIDLYTAFRWSHEQGHSFDALREETRQTRAQGYAAYDVDYVLIKAAGLPSIVVAPSAVVQVPVAITNQPRDQSVVELSAASFTVGAAGNPVGSKFAARPDA